MQYRHVPGEDFAYCFDNSITHQKFFESATEIVESVIGTGAGAKYTYNQVMRRHMLRTYECWLNNFVGLENVHWQYVPLPSSSYTMRFLHARHAMQFKLAFGGV